MQFQFSYFYVCVPGSEAGYKGERTIVFLPRWLLLVSDYYLKLLVHVSAENSCSQQTKSSFHTTEIQLTSQLEPQWELPKRI